jgi:FkbM family methyltransferase
VILQRFLHNSVRLAQYWQGIGGAGKVASAADRAVLHQLKGNRGPLVIFDVGANRGQFLQLTLTQLAGRQTVIHAFEPSRAAFLNLQQRFGTQSGTMLNNFALGHEAAQRTLYYDVAGSELSSLYPRKVEQHGIYFSGSEPVQVDTLDNYCAAQDVSRIDLLKLDVEGHELHVLNGAVQMFERGAIGIASFEFGGCNVDSRTFVRDFFEFFTSRNMRLARVTASGKLCPIAHYEEGLEQFRTTCFLAFRRETKRAAPGRN